MEQSTHVEERACHILQLKRKETEREQHSLFRETAGNDEALHMRIIKKAAGLLC